MLDCRCHSHSVVARFVAARAHVDKVIAKLVVDEFVPAAGSAPGRVPVQRTSAVNGVSASIADAIAALDLAFELWLGSSACAEESEPST